MSHAPPAQGEHRAHRESGRRSWIGREPVVVDRALVEAWCDEADGRQRTTRRHLRERLAGQRAAEFAPGISVVALASGEEDYWATCLESLERQTLDREHFEVIVVLPSSAEVGFEAAPTHPKLALRVIKLDAASDDWAREAGISAIRRAYTTFLDDGDRFPPTYLEVLFAHANPKAIVVVPAAG